MKELAAVLILRGLDLSPREAEQKRKYLIKSIPAAASAERIGGRLAGDRQAARTTAARSGRRGQWSARQLRRTSRARRRIGLAVRSILPLIANGALVGIRGFDRNKDSDERSPSSVIDAMRRTNAGFGNSARSSVSTPRARSRSRDRRHRQGCHRRGSRTAVAAGRRLPAGRIPRPRQGSARVRRAISLATSTISGFSTCKRRSNVWTSPETKSKPAASTPRRTVSTTVPARSAWT